MALSSGGVGQKGTIPAGAASSAPPGEPPPATSTAVESTPESTHDGDRVLGARSATKEAKARSITRPTPTVKPLDALDIPSVFPIDDLSQIRSTSSAGQVFRLDGGTLDGLALNVRRFVDADGTPGTSITFKLTGPARREMHARMTKLGAAEIPFEVAVAKPEVRDGQLVLVRTGESHPIKGMSHNAAPDTATGPARAARMTGEGWTLDLVPDNSLFAVRGLVRLDLSGDDKKCSAALKEAIKKLGLGSIFAPPTATSLRRFALFKLLWRTDPQAANAMSRSVGSLNDLKPEVLEKALADRGVSKERMDAIQYREVAPGHFTVVDDRIVEEMKAAGLHYAYSTVERKEHVLSILVNGQKATVTRWQEGAVIAGMSSNADLATGGAQGVFSRLVTSNGEGQGWFGRTYKVILKPEHLARMDIWGWPDDEYGRAWKLMDRNFGAKLVKDIAGGTFNSSNEIVSPVANSPDMIACVVAPTEAQRKDLIDHLEANGWRPRDGRSVEEFVVVSPKIDVNLLSKAMPSKPAVEAAAPGPGPDPIAMAAKALDAAIAPKAGTGGAVAGGKGMDFLWKAPISLNADNLGAVNASVLGVGLCTGKVTAEELGQVWSFASTEFKGAHYLDTDADGVVDVASSAAKKAGTKEAFGFSEAEMAAMKAFIAPKKKAAKPGEEADLLKQLFEFADKLEHKSD